MCPQAFKHILEKKTEKTPPLPSVSSILLPRAFVFSQADAQAHCLGKQVQVPPVEPSERNGESQRTVCPQSIRACSLLFADILLGVCWSQTPWGQQCGRGRGRR